MHFMDLGKIKQLCLIRGFTPAKTWAYTANKHPNQIRLVAGFTYAFTDKPDKKNPD